LCEQLSNTASACENTVIVTCVLLTLGDLYPHVHNSPQLGPRRRDLVLPEQLTENRISQFSRTHPTGAPTHRRPILQFQHTSRTIFEANTTFRRDHTQRAHECARVRTECSRSGPLACLTSFPQLTQAAIGICRRSGPTWFSLCGGPGKLRRAICRAEAGSCLAFLGGYIGAWKK
jgi:hypothetical protein